MNDDQNKIFAPFSKNQVDQLTRWQNSDRVHPFTCCDHLTMRVTTGGFVCPKCLRVHNWAHKFMATPFPNPLLDDPR